MFNVFRAYRIIINLHSFSSSSRGLEKFLKNSTTKYVSLSLCLCDYPYAHRIVSLFLWISNYITRKAPLHCNNLSTAFFNKCLFSIGRYPNHTSQENSSLSIKQQTNKKNKKAPWCLAGSRARSSTRSRWGTPGSPFSSGTRISSRSAPGHR